MPMTFPLALDDFFALLPVAEMMFHAPPQVIMNQTGGGEILTADVGPMLWTGQVTLGRMLQSETATPDVLLDLLAPAGRTFWAFDTRRPGPLADPKGLVLGSATPVIASLPNAREMSISGLPGWYVLSRGDYLAFDYGIPARRALHKVVTPVVEANAAGTTPVFEVTPMIRPGAVTATAVTLVRAACKARLIPGRVEKGMTRNSVTEGMSFAFTQTLR